jgi:catechol 2,3-dioxygenase-like lactoylglutathione lyase family enzyme
MSGRNHRQDRYAAYRDAAGIISHDSLAVRPFSVGCLRWAQLPSARAIMRVGGKNASGWSACETVVQEPVMIKLQGMTPMLNVQDIDRSLAFYRDTLGFELASSQEALEERNWCYIRHGAIHLMLDGGTSEGEALFDPDTVPEDGAWHAIYYFYPEDVVALHSQLADSGYDVSELYVTAYGMREFWLKDPDGHLLTFGQPTAVPG